MFVGYARLMGKFNQKTGQKGLDHFREFRATTGQPSVSTVFQPLNLDTNYVHLRLLDLNQLLSGHSRIEFPIF